MCHSKKGIPATSESREALYENAGKTIDILAPILEMEILIKKNLDADTHKILGALLSLDIFCQYIHIEIITILRACLKAETDLLAERRYNLKYINCVIYEAYKSLYGFGDARSEFWKSNVRDVLREVDDSQLQNDLTSLENRIIQLNNDKIANTDQRNLSFHYDPDPLRVYDMLMSLSEEDEFKRTFNFLDNLVAISAFANKYINQYAVRINVASSYKFSFSEIDVFKNKKEQILYVTGEAIEKHSKQLDGFVRQLNIPARIKQQFGEIDNEPYTVLNQMVDILKAAIQLLYIYIDLASATRAFIGSEHILEKQLSMKQINTIFYEGFNKIYGLNNNDGKVSFWAKYIVPVISDNVDSLMQEEFEGLSKGLDSLRGYVKTLKKQRLLSVKYIDIVEVYDMLDNLNPLVEFQKALLFLKLLPRLLDFFSKCLSVIDLRSKVESKKRDESRNKMIDKMLAILEMTPENQQKEEIVKMLTRIKTGEFFEEIFQKHRIHQ